MDLGVLYGLASPPGCWSSKEKAFAPPPVKRARPRVSGATPPFPMVAVVQAVAPGAVTKSASLVPDTGLVSATGWQVVAPASMRSAGVLAPGLAAQGPSSTLSRT